MQESYRGMKADQVIVDEATRLKDELLNQQAWKAHRIAQSRPLGYTNSAGQFIQVKRAFRTALFKLFTAAESADISVSTLAQSIIEENSILLPFKVGKLKVEMLTIGSRLGMSLSEIRETLAHCLMVNSREKTGDKNL